MTPKPSSPMTAAFWMMGAIASFTLMAVAGRKVQTEMNSFELMAWRSAIGVLVISSILWAKGFSQIKTRVPWLHVKRNILHFMGQNFWFYALPLIPLSQLVAIEFTNPIWVALLAPFFLGEQFTARKLAVVALGFVGILIVAQPGVTPIKQAHFAALGAAIGFAFNTLYTRSLMAHDSVLCVLFWMTLSQMIMGAILGAPNGIPVPSLEIAPWLIIVGITGLSAHYALTSALSHAPATLVAPMEFFRLPIITMVGVYVYHEDLYISVFVGAAIIFAANLLNIYSSKR